MHIHSLNICYNFRHCILSRNFHFKVFRLVPIQFFRTWYTNKFTDKIIHSSPTLFILHPVYRISRRPLADRILPKLFSPHLQFSTPTVRRLKHSSIVIGKPRSQNRSAGWIPYSKYFVVFLSLYENVKITEITPRAPNFKYSNSLFA